MLSILLLAAISGCATNPPAQPHDICSIFRENSDWYESAMDAREKWGAPVHVTMAIMKQESSFIEDAAPPMQYFLGFIPIGRASDAYGYAQAKDDVWGEYTSGPGGWFADRDDFGDAIDFIGWYMYHTQRINKVSMWDTYNQYLNYHEGRGGYSRGSHNKKPSLLKIARKVDSQAKNYSQQYWGCKQALDRGWFWQLFG
jgi:hypothetical protein